ncbi:box C/D snoRNA protein 1 [Danio aesculapii]|uniref:box C/D snoRNA protein 1 n=1 Tax=Danio aesculapii TaxID=1142201 RepID=UPI0024BFA1CA|nr:box C/D snoRNA protein 1 [Danio aesculapii]
MKINLPDMDNKHTADEERRAVKRKMAMSSCDVCDCEEAKYRCPSCKKHTCSLVCVKRHKSVSGCSGVRDQTAFVSLSDFREIHMLSDYRFLEDSARLRQQSSRDTVMTSGRQHPKQGQWMIRKAKAVKVTLKLLPKVFSKHRENTTIFINRERQFHWHLKIHFPQSDAVYSERRPDNTPLEQILHGYIHPSEADPVRLQKLKLYVSSQQNIRVFLKAELEQLNSLRYHELELNKTLQENLMCKSIIEYPELFVVLDQHSQQYRTAEPDAPGEGAANISRSSSCPSETAVQKKPRVSEDLEDGELRSEDEDGEGGTQNKHTEDEEQKKSSNTEQTAGQTEEEQRESEMMMMMKDRPRQS